MTTHASPEFAQSLQTRFGTGRRFTEAYLDYFESAQGTKVQSQQDLERLDETRRMWFEYAMSSNRRGTDLVRQIEEYKELSGLRYLDIGCGFGGCLLAAAQNHASACVGIEMDPVRAEFARKNLADFNLAVPVDELDALAPGIEDRLGTFDVITCNDVAEHVESPAKLVQNLRRLLRLGGIAYLEIPNGKSIEFVRSDGHFGLFGITLLDRDHAKAYHGERFDFEYDVGHYLSLEEYLNLFEEAGLKAALIDSLYHPTRPMSEVDEQLNSLEPRRHSDPRIDPAYRRYRAQLAADRLKMRKQAFRDRYLRNFWTFVATPAAPRKHVGKSLA